MIIKRFLHPETQHLRWGVQDQSGEIHFPKRYEKTAAYRLMKKLQAQTNTCPYPYVHAGRHWVEAISFNTREPFVFQRGGQPHFILGDIRREWYQAPVIQPTTDVVGPFDYKTAVLMAQMMK